MAKKSASAKPAKPEEVKSPPPPPPSINVTEEDESKSYDLSGFKGIADLVRDHRENIDAVKPYLMDYINALAKAYNVDNYNILFIYAPEQSITESTADSIYSSLSNVKKPRDILLVINSRGGEIEPAYLISKCCKEYSKKFAISIPRKAKSAATLTALGADEIHMGMMSELGPIDPQFSGLPALGLSSALETLAETVEKYPASYQMFSDYLAKQLDLRTLGYFERVSKSAVQYAERLLEGKTFPDGKTTSEVANQFVYGYQDHGFVIDKEEASLFLGDIIKSGTDEYLFGNQCHSFLDNLGFLLRFLTRRDFTFIGNYFNFWERQDK